MTKYATGNVSMFEMIRIVSRLEEGLEEGICPSFHFSVW